ncbi:MAG: GNAT family N-acetyltransferase [Oligoflexales bacterium]
MADKQKISLIVREATKEDVAGIEEVYAKVYGQGQPYGPEILGAQIQNFPEGQFVAEYNGKIIGYCASIILPESVVMKPHTWREATNSGYGSTHDPDGDYLYGVEIFIDPTYRNVRIGDRFYRKRKDLCRYLRLKGIVFGGRMSLYSRHQKKLASPQDYLDQVKEKKIKDPVINFQVRQGFEIIGVLENYYPPDPDSLGYAAHMIWRNPETEESATPDSRPYKKLSESMVRVATVQYMQRGISSFVEFEQIIEYFIDVVADYRSDFVLFPELFTLQLLSLENEQLPADLAIAKLAEHKDALDTLFTKLAVSYNVNIVAGSHPTHVDNQIQNVAYIYLRDGSIHAQPKIHPTPNERFWWNMEGGDKVSVIHTDCGPIGVLICYDAEFPELARRLVDQGAKILFVPFCTDERQSYMRVRYCCQARAVENQVFVAMAGNVGNLPKVHNMDIQYAQSCILTPCDFCFSRDGIAADSSPNVEMVSFADLRLEDLNYARHQGTVKNLKDRRHDLYSVVWHKRI